MKKIEWRAVDDGTFYIADIGDSDQTGQLTVEEKSPSHPSSSFWWTVYVMDVRWAAGGAVTLEDAQAAAVREIERFARSLPDPRITATRVLLEDAKSHRQLTPTELDIERLVAGDLAGPELEQLLRRGR